jgi:dienelactone hydrolase
MRPLFTESTVGSEEQTVSNRISIDSHGTAIETELFTPASGVNGGAIVLAHGSDGMTEPWDAMIRDFATQLAGKGFIALIPKYFEKTGSTPGPQIFLEMSTNLGSWEIAVADTLSYARKLPGISGSRVGLLGFSLGGHICLRLRGSVTTLVEFFAPELPEFGGLGSAAVPASFVQIHHGKADTLVPYSNALTIKAALEREGTAPEMCPYEGAVHGFIGDDPNDATARTSSKARTLAFCEAHL